MLRSVVRRRFISRHFGGSTTTPSTATPTPTTSVPSFRTSLLSSVAFASSSVRGASTSTGGLSKDDNISPSPSSNGVPSSSPTNVQSAASSPTSPTTTTTKSDGNANSAVNNNNNNNANNNKGAGSNTTVPSTVSMETYNNGTLPSAKPLNGNGSNPPSTTASAGNGRDISANEEVGGNAPEISSAERRYWLKTLLNAATTRFLMTGSDSDDAAASSQELKNLQQQKEAENNNKSSPSLKTGTTATSAAKASAIEAEVEEEHAKRKEQEHKLYVSHMTAPPMRLRRSEERGSPGVPGTRAGSKVEQQIRRELRTRQPATSVNDLLNYNKKWSSTIRRIDPTYFADLAKQQSPKFLWIGCADSRVPANQILGLAPGEVFVHRNVANIVSRSDLNCLSVVQFGVEHLRVEQLLVVGHYGCGGVTAAYKGLTLGLVDNWVSNVADIKHRNEAALARVPEEERIDCLCDLNAITQALNVAESNVVQAHWRVFREEQDDDDDDEGEDAATDTEQQKSGTASTASSAEGEESSKTATKAKSPPKPQTKQPLRVHGWCYGLKDGLVHPLVDFGPYDDPRAKAEEAIEAAVKRRLEAYERRNRKPIVEGL